MKYEVGKVYFWTYDYDYNSEKYKNVFMKVLSVREKRTGYKENGLAYTICSCKRNGSQIGKDTCEWTERELNARGNIIPLNEWIKSDIENKKKKIEKLKKQIEKLEKEIADE